MGISNELQHFEDAVSGSDRSVVLLQDKNYNSPEKKGIDNKPVFSHSRCLDICEYVRTPNLLEVKYQRAVEVNDWNIR